MRKITYYLALALSAIAISCNNDEPNEPNKPDIPDNFTFDTIDKYIEFDAEGGELFLENIVWKGTNTEHGLGSDIEIGKVFSPDFTKEHYEEIGKEYLAGNTSLLDEVINGWKAPFTIDSSHFGKSLTRYDFYGNPPATDSEIITALHNDKISLKVEGENNDKLLLKVANSPEERVFYIEFYSRNILGEEYNGEKIPSTHNIKITQHAK